MTALDEFGFMMILLRFGLVIVTDDVTKESSPKKWDQNAQFVFESHMRIKQAVMTQTLDALPTTVLQFFMVVGSVLITEQQDIEIGT